MEVRHKGLLTLSIMLATVMQALDSTIANVALPSMRGSLGAGQDQITWVLTSYIVAAAIMTPLTGWLTDRFGLRQVFNTSVAGFTIISMACGIASSLNEMVLFRVLQGLFGACLVPLSQTVLLDINPKERHGQAMAFWGAGVMLGPIIGPTLGGWLTETFDWRYVFFVNLPVGILAFFGILFFLPKVPSRPRVFDFIGFFMLSLAIGALQMMLDRGQDLDWFASSEIWIETGLAVSGIWMFAFHIAGSDHPFIDPVILKDRNLMTAVLLVFMVGAILLAGSALLPGMLQNILGYPVSLTGLVLAPRGLGTMMAMMVVGRLVGRVDVRLLILFGLGLTAYSLHMMTGYSVLMGRSPIVSSGIVQGFGLGFVFVPLSTIAFSTLEPRHRANAAGLFSLVRNIGSSIGISLASAILSWNIAINRTEMTGKLTPSSPRLTGVLEGTGLDHATLLSVINSQITAQASMIAYIDDFKLMMLVTLALMPLVLIMRKPTIAGR
ncbi:DHA2 family efflux MFS transporter permease subunit [Consotaella salsifontis]|uniref:DHA2 family efflux MFS transporter permease subunit n=1 Tax=Consotaella salsifontis TaxID=1365950 RepID=UPI002477E7F0|nr:DHA2 family efflux MFS transporter permease subunit [Consotaella salsifontis]